VEENPPRISYNRAIELVKGSAGLVVLGVDDPAYMPSKLFTYSLSGKPLLVCLHHLSQACSYFEQNPEVGHLIRFGDPSESAFKRDREVFRRYLREVLERRTFDRRYSLQPYLSPAAAERHAELFHSIVAK
jgi:hypothetical protein